MSQFITSVIFGTGIVVWCAVAVAALWLAKATAVHAGQAWEMAGRIVNESATKRSRIRWWWHMFMHGPMTSMTTTDTNHTVYWPGREPKGWYSHSPR